MRDIGTMMTGTRSVVAMSLVLAELFGCGENVGTPRVEGPDGQVGPGGSGVGSGGGSTNGGGPFVTGGNSGAGRAGYPSATGGVPDSGGRNGTGGKNASTGGSPTPDGGRRVPYVFVIAMENHDASSIVGNAADAKYINGTLLHLYASASNYIDPLPLSIVSEPHYVWMEAGTNVFSDHTFTSDSNPSATNSTSSTQHLATQITRAGLTYVSYQESIDGAAGACPIHGSADGFYAPKHDPFVFFQDVTGTPPSTTAANCVAHHKALGTLSPDLKAGTIANYNFITPNLCNDMHGAANCPSSNTIQAGDQWLSANLPALITFSNSHDGVIFIVWDEGESSKTIPFIAVGPRIVPGRIGTVEYGHSSLLKSVEELLGLPVLPTVTAANDFADLFQPGQFP